MARLTEQEALSLLIEAVENDHAVYAGSAEAVARWKRLRVFAFNALGAEERGRRRGLEEAVGLLKEARIWIRTGIERTPQRDSFLASIDHALAPRDSAPDSVTSYAVPRDPGKEGDELMRALRDSATVSTRPPTDRK